MGCFNFTYADNGDNIRGCRGYIYLSPQVAKEADLPNPLPFSYADSYGRFTISLCARHKGGYYAEIDIYALYTVLIQTDENKRTADADRFISLLCNRQFDNEFERLNDSLRDYGIDYFFQHLKQNINGIPITVPRIGNQKPKRIKTYDVFHGTTPLLISKKKLPVDVNTSLQTMAQTWGYVSTDDPRQGFAPTRNLYCGYIV